MKTLILLAAAVLARAQNPATPYYPGSVVPQNAMGVGVNSVTAKLAEAITATATSARVDSAAPVLIGTYMKLESEYVLVCGKTGNTLQFGRASCPNVDGRGVEGSTRAAHSIYKVLTGFVPAGGWNQITAEIRAIEQAPGGGGTPGGTDSAVQVNAAGAFGGNSAKLSFVTTPLSTPAAPAVSVHGTTGSTTYSYAVAVRSLVGPTMASTDATVTNGNASLTGTNYNIITPAACPALGVSVDVFRTNGGNTGWIATLACGASLNDTGLDSCVVAAYGCGVPVTNTSAGAFSDGAFRVTGHAAFGEGIPDRDPSHAVGYVDQVGLLVFQNARSVAQDNGAIGLESVLHIDASGINGGSFFAAANEVETAAANTDNIGELAATSNDAIHRGSGTISLMVGFDNGVTNQSTGTVQRAIGLRGAVHNNGIGHVDTMTGIDGSVDSSGGGSTVTDGIIFRANATHGSFTNLYGLKVDDQAAALHNWAIKTGIGLNEFGDAVQFDAPADSKPDCDASIRFRLWTTAGGSGTKDSVEICAKDDSDTYAWRALY